MMKKRNLMLIIVLGMLGLSGCNKAETVEIAPAPAEPPQGIAIVEKTFETVDLTTIDEERRLSYERLVATRGYQFWEETPGDFTLLISSGEKNSGGYGIEVVSIDDNEGNTVVVVKETAPKEGDMVTMALTYPYTVIKVSGVTDKFTVVSDLDAPFERLQEGGEK